MFCWAQYLQINAYSTFLLFLMRQSFHFLESSEILNHLSFFTVFSSAFPKLSFLEVLRSIVPDCQVFFLILVFCCNVCAPGLNSISVFASFFPQLVLKSLWNSHCICFHVEFFENSFLRSILLFFSRKNFEKNIHYSSRVFFLFLKLLRTQRLQ